MKDYAKMVVLTTLIGLLLATCGTKKQLKDNASIVPVTPIAPQEDPQVIDSVTHAPLRPYYRYRYHQNLSYPGSRYRLQLGLTSAQDDYEDAFRSLKEMLEEKTNPDFEHAVFISENPYHDNAYTYRAFQKSINWHVFMIKNLIAANDKSNEMNFDVRAGDNGRFKLDDLRYLPKERKELYRKALTNWAIFKYLTDTVYTQSGGKVYFHAPFEYASHDPFGIKDWSNSQVLRMLASEEQQGNCFALTGLYKILADRLDADARICTAPQHIYIQHRDMVGHYYNVELATAGHPGDGIIQTLTYTPSEAIMSGISLRDYNTKQSIGLCLVNLAKSYEHKFNTKDDAFLLRCAELALKHDSLNLNALLLKEQVLDARVTAYAIKHHKNSISQLKNDAAIAATTRSLETHIAMLYRLGYRQMPFDMQEMILHQLEQTPSKWNHKSKNPRPFTTLKPLDPKDEEYWTLTKGMFQEIFEPKKREQYSHFTLNTETKKLVAMDTSSQKGFIIDPVAFAYDFGARMYDARIGHFIGVDPLTFKTPQWSPYVAFNDNPLYFIDPTGMSANPIYDTDGNLMGTDDKGLKGSAIVMDKEDFDKNGGQGMKHEDAEKLNKGIGAIKDQEARKRFADSYTGLSSRPDFDGEMSYFELVAWGREHGNQPVFLDASRINLGSTSVSDFPGVGEGTLINTPMKLAPINTSGPWGKNFMTLLSADGKVKLSNDRFDYEQHDLVDAWRAGFGTFTYEVMIRYPQIYLLQKAHGIDEHYGFDLRPYGYGQVNLGNKVIK